MTPIIHHLGRPSDVAALRRFYRRRRVTIAIVCVELSCWGLLAAVVAGLLFVWWGVR